MKNHIRDLLYDEIKDEKLRKFLWEIINLEEKKRRETFKPRGIKKDIKDKIIRHLRGVGGIK